MKNSNSSFLRILYITAIDNMQDLEATPSFLFYVSICKFCKFYLDHVIIMMTSIYVFYIYFGCENSRKKV